MKREIYKGLGLLLLCILVIAGYGGYRFYKLSTQETEEKADLIQEAAFPIIHTRFEGNPVTTLQGYGMEMDLRYMRDQLTVLGAGRDLEFEVEGFGNHITGVTIDVLEMDGTQVDHYVSPAWEKTETGILVLTALSDEIGTLDDYMLRITLATESQKALYYYSVLRYLPDAPISSQIAFLKDFSDKTFDQKEAESIIPYIEPSETARNNNLGHVDITASFNQITWDNFKLERTSEPQVTISDINSETGSYVLTYDGQTIEGEDIPVQYHVTEFYRICYHEGRTYLVSFDRKMEQVYNPEIGNVSASRMNLGIDSDLEIAYRTSGDRRQIAFVKENQLWLMDTDANRITRIFSFYDDAHQSIRDRIADHGIEIVNVTDEGTVDFLVYGYMNRGTLEGENGVVLYRYNSETNRAEELIFLPSDRPYSVLKESIHKICYLTEQFFYIYLDPGIYCVDLQGKTYIQLIPDLPQDGYCSDESGRRLAWTDALETNNTIRIKDLQTGMDLILEGSEGKILVPIGFLGEDFAYGTVEEGNIVSVDGSRQILISELTIIDSEKQVLKQYQKKNRLIANCDVTSARIAFDLVQKKQSGKSVSLKNMGTDQILSNTEQETSGVTLETIVTEARQTEVVLRYASAVISSEKIQVRTPETIQMAAENTLTIKELQKKDSNYYVYGLGKLQSVETSMARAQQAADQWKGFFTDSSNQVIWSYRETFKS